VPKPERNTTPKSTTTDDLTPDQEGWLFNFLQMRRRMNHAGICYACGSRLTYRRRGSGHQRTKFCSTKCNYIFNVYKARYDAGLKECRCGAAFFATRKHTRYCSTACSKAAEQQQGRDYRKAHPERKQLKRRREREQYAVMIAFRRMGLLPTTGEIKT
jgi:hypothetical protein